MENNNLPYKRRNKNTDNNVLSNQIGDTSSLSTADKSSLVNALNEVRGGTATTATLGNLVNLTTTDKTSIVNALNEVKSNVNTNTTTIGNAALKTTAQTVKGAINENYDQIGILNKKTDGIEVNIKERGALMNGTNEATLLQSLIDELSASGGGTILIPKGTLTVNSTINLKSNVNIRGVGWQSRITTTTGSSGNGMNILQSIEQENIVISDLKIENLGYGKSGEWTPAGSVDGAGCCVMAANTKKITVQNCHLYNGGGQNGGEGVGNVWFSCCTSSKIINNTIEKGDNAICVDRWFSNYNVDGVNRSGIYNTGIVISGNNCFNMSGRGVAIENVNNKGSIEVVANTFTSCTWAGIEGRDFTNCVIANNVFEGLPILKTFGNTWDNMYYGVNILNDCKKVIIEGNNFQNMKVHGMQLFNADEFNITGNRISNVTDNYGIFMKNASPDGGVTPCNLNIGSITDNLFVDVAIGIYIRKDGTDISTLNNVTLSDNTILFRTIGIQLEYANWFNVNGNTLIPKTTYGGTIGIKGSNIFRCQFKNNLIPNCSTGFDLNTDNSTNTANRFDTCTTSIKLTNCTNTILTDVVRGGTTAISSVSGNSGVDATGVKYSGGVVTIKTGFNVKVRYSAAAAPTSGDCDKGDIVDNNSPSAGGYIGFVGVTTGIANNNTWAATTAYTVGQQVNAFSKVYECTVAGTSGGTAPSHTSGTATDGTVTWQYKNALAPWKGFGAIQA